MAFCTNCGASANENDKFCEQCGESIEQVTQPNQIPQTEQVTQTNQPSEQATITQKPNKKHSKMIVAIISLIVILAAAIFGITYYFVNQNKTVTIPVIKVANAQEAVKKLKKQGLKVQVSKEPSPSKKGSFLKLKGVKQGERVNSSKPITVVESLGPGMPKNVIGKTLKSITREVKEMGVPVKVYEVATTSKPGTVIATYPMPGQAFEKSDYADSMRIAVSVNSNKKAIPIDIYGADKNNAKSKLEKVGINNIEFKPRFSSRKLIGKIVGSHPSLGSEITEENEKVTLYYGIDAKDTKNSLAIPITGTDWDTSDLPSGTRLAINFGPMAGEWCTNSGKCIYLNEYYPNNDNHLYSDVLLENHPMKLRSIAELPERFFTNTIDSYLSLTNYSQDISGAILFDPKVHTKIQYDTMKNHLLSGDTGAAEFYKGFDLPSCGKVNLFTGGPAAFCVHGKVVNITDNPDQFDENDQYLGSQDDINTGLVYKMHDFFVLIPVNAKLEQLEKSGYFRSTGKHTPDLNRPFILRRDPKLYSKTEIPIPDHGTWGPDYDTSPFVPTKKHKAIPFAPAPDDDNAYYKVENPVNWSDLQPAKTL